MPSFIYHPLDPTRLEIRLIYLLPHGQTAGSGTAAGSRHSDMLSCTMQCVSLDDKPEYMALSYVWGDPQATRPILVDTNVFQVTVNLESALRQSQLDKDLVILWIDALCINQDDSLEKTYQVQCMGNIYRSAAKLLIWLRPADIDSDIAMDAMQKQENHAISHGVGEVDVDTWPKYPSEEQELGRRTDLDRFLTEFTIKYRDTDTLRARPTQHLLKRAWW
jgi:hypothetical protein